MDVVVLRLGHRPERDKRITTHVGLVSRAFGAREMLLSGRDDGVVASLRDVVDRWGGDFVVRDNIRWKEEIRRFRDSGGKVVHLTMYGSNLPDVVSEVRAAKKLMIVVGAEKVPSELYDLADWNLAVGNQPHSEVAALAVLLDRVMEGEELEKDFGGSMEIIPSPRGKRVIERSGGDREQAEIVLDKL